MVEHTNSAKVRSGVNIAYTTKGDPTKRAILLIHGYPQTRHSMRGLQSLLSNAGYFTLAADYRGAGSSSITADGYDKMTMSADLHILMKDVLGYGRYAVLGHDIGAMVAVAQSLQYRDSVEALIFMGEYSFDGLHGLIDRPRMSSTWYESVRFLRQRSQHRF